MRSDQPKASLALTLFSFLVTGIFFASMPGPGHGETPVGENIRLVMKAEKGRIYLHEKVPLTLTLYTPGYLLRDIQYPQLSHQDLSIEEFERAGQKREVLNGAEFEALEFKSTLSGMKIGRFILGPARLQCTLLVPREGGRSPVSPGSRTEEYFGAWEPRALSLISNEISLSVLPLPAKSKPPEFSGAVGNFRMSLEVHPKEVRIGEPITLKLMFEGQGSFDTIRPPRIEPGRGFHIYAPQGRREKGIQIYEQVLVAESETLREIPEIRFSFFDPEKGEYRTVRKGPIPVKVKEPEGDKIPKSLSLGIASGDKNGSGTEIVPIKKSQGRLRRKGDFLYRNRLYLILHGLPLSLLFSLWLWNKRRERIRADGRYARLLEAKRGAAKGLREAEKALKQGKPLALHDSMFKTLQDYLGNRFDFPSRTMTSEEAAGILRSKGVDEQILLKIETLFSQCNLARYGLSEFNPIEREDAFRMLKEVLSRLEEKRS